MTKNFYRSWLIVFDLDFAVLLLPGTFVVRKANKIIDDWVVSAIYSVTKSGDFSPK